MTSLRGDALNKAIQLELDLIKAEGNVEEITPALVHRRLVAKGIISGQVSTLSPKERSEMIIKANKEYQIGLGFNKKELGILSSRNSKDAYIQRIGRQNREIEELKNIYLQTLIL
ncbi:hypothetical protein [Photobacterium leiognathi]|uniref:hypothetical protein n=1 Tax=Photobacterium leiognathi TaxID=553611 RepID=UPI002738B100|nr:hypothetical protein [Photobacterium leiognathi]